MRHWFRTLTLTTLLAVLASPALADLEFQAVDEWEFLRFTYPNGKARLLSEGTEISAFSRALSDTTGQGIPFDAYLSYVDEDGDSVGVFIWQNPPPDMYFFVETAGLDSVFAAPDFYRMGHKAAPPGSVDSLAIAEGMVLTKHLADSLVSSPKYLASGVIRDVHLAPNLDGSKLLAGTVGPSTLASGERFFSASGGDEVEAQEGYFARVQPAPGGPMSVVGPTEITLGHDMESGSDLTFESGSSLLANSGATVDLSTTVDLGATAQPTTVRGPLIVQADMTFGAAATHDATFSGSASVAESLVVGANADTTTSHPVKGFFRYLQGVDVTVSALNTGGVVAFPGAEEGMIFEGFVVSSSSTAYNTNMMSVRYESPGYVRWSVVSYGSSRDFYIVGHRR